MQNPSLLCPQCQSPIPADAPGGLCPACVLLGVAGPTNPSQAAAAAMPTREEVAAAFPELEVLEFIGQGGMGIVFKARQPRLDRFVALKILPPALAAQPGFAERFTREARVLARLAHPHIVAIYDFGESAGFYYLIMEFVDGVNLRAAMRAGVKPEQALLLVPRICEALQFAHDHGVLHRDIKPENILLDTAGTPKLADFGIAKLAGEESGKTGLTATGAALGTAAYMAPEQVEKPATVDHRADIYSLGVVLYEMLTGELPLGRFAAPSEKSTVNRGVDDVVMRALEKERERRQQSAGEMKTQVEGAAHHAGGGRRTAFETVSERRIFGIPLYHIVTGVDPQTGFPPVARGIFASGPVAKGVIAAGGRAHGLIAFGGLAVGVIAVGGMSCGLLTVGGVGLGMATFGGLSLGAMWAGGGVALGVHPTGGLAIGVDPRGGLAIPVHLPDPLLWLLVTAFTVGILALIMGTVLPDLLGVARSARQQPVANPWPHRLFWLIASLVVLPVVAVFCALVAPQLMKMHNDFGTHFGRWAVAFIGLLPMIAGGALYFGYRHTRPGADRARPQAEWDLWPKRIFLLIFALVVVPAMLLVLGVLIPALSYRSVQQPAPPRVVGFPPPGGALLQEQNIRLARQRLAITKANVQNGTMPAIEQAAAERDLAVAEAHGDEVKVAAAQVAYAELRLKMLQVNAQAGHVSAAEVLEGEQTLNAARLQLERAKRKPGPAADLPALEKPTQP